MSVRSAPGGGLGTGPAKGDDSIIGQAYDARLMKRMLGYLKPYGGYVILAVLLLLVGTAVELALPLVIKTTVDQHIAVVNLDGLPAKILLFLALLAAGFALRFVQLYLTQWIGQKAVYDLRTGLFNHLQRQDLKFIDSRPVGWLMTRVTGDVQTLYEMFSQGVVSVFGDLFMLVGIVAVMLVLNVKLALTTFVVLPLLFWAVFLFRSRVRVTFQTIREALANLNGFMQEHISGVRTIQLFGIAGAVASRFHDYSRAYRNAYLKAIRYFAIFFPAVNFISALAVALILLTGGLMIRSETLTWGALVAFLQYAERFFRPIRDLSERYNTMQAAMAAAERVFWLLDTQPQVVDGPIEINPGGIKGEIGFDNVSFEYKAGEPVLSDISFKIKPGETVAVVGATGAGKTTLISLIMRFWDVNSGRILLDGRDIREYRLKDLRRMFAVVLQDVFLFSGTIRENITLGEPSDNDGRLMSALRSANADRLIEGLPKGVDETVGERGARLSGGEKQLVAIARALAADPPLLLLDEATAAIDTETERRIQDALDRLMQGRTTLVIAHRLSTIRNADRIVVLHKGRLREIGTHRELLEQNGIYARLYRLQFAEEVGV